MNPTLIKKLQEKIANDAYLLYEALANLADDNAEKITAALEAINDYMKDIGEAAQKAHLVGLSKVCQQTGKNITTLSVLNSEQLQSLCIEVERWPRLVSNYLYSPTNSNTHDQLIHFLQNAEWPHPIENELANQLREGLNSDFINQADEIAESQIEPEISANNPKNIRESVAQEENINERVDEINEIIEPQTPTKIETAHKKQPKKAIKKTTEIAKGDTKITAQEKRGHNEEKVTTDSPNDSSHATDVLATDLLYDKILDMNEHLSVALTQVISLDAENENFFEGLNQYTDTIQIFWELAESLGLKGFQEVCTFINDNMFECSSLSQLEKKKLQKPLKLWPKKALAYLKNPNTHAQKLINVLCTNSWPISLSTKKSEHLLTQLIQDCSAPMIVKNNPTKKPEETYKSSDNLIAVPTENDSLNAEPVSVEISSNQSSESEVFSNNENISNDTSEKSEKFESFYQENEFEPFELDSFNLINSENSSEVEEAWISSHVGNAWIEKDFNTGWESKKEERVSTLYQPVTEEDSIMEESHAVYDEKSRAMEEELSVNQLEKIENFSNGLDKLSREDANLLSDFTQEKVSLESQAFQEDSEYAGEEEVSTVEIDNENQESITEIEELAVEELAIADSEFDEEWLNTQKVTEFEDNDDNLDVSIEEEELSLQNNSNVLIDSVVEPDENVVQTAEELTTQLEEDLAEYSFDDTDEFAEEPLPDLLTDDASETPDLLNQDKTQSIQDTDSISNQVSKDAEQITPVSDLSIEEETLFVEEPSLFDEDDELSDNFSMLDEKDEKNVSTEESEELVTEAQDIFDEDLLLEASQVTEDLLVAEEISSEEEDLLVAKEISLEDSQDSQNSQVTEDLLIAEEISSEDFQVTEDLLVAEEISSEDSQVIENEEIFAEDLLVAEEVSLDDFQVTEDLLVAEEVSLEDSQVTEDLSAEVPNLLAKENADIVAPSQSSDKIILCSQEVLELLMGQIRDIAEDNASFLTDLLESEENSETVLTATMTYTENVQAIWDAAEMANLTGLQDICLFVNDNVMALGNQSQKEREPMRDVLLAWSEYVVSYLQNPMPNNVDRLINGLQDKHWPTPLDDEAAIELKHSLLTPSANADIESTVVDEASSHSETEEKELEVASEQEIFLVPPEVLELLIAQISDISENNAELINKLVGAEEGSDAVFTAITNYTDNVQAVWEAAEMGNLNGLLEVCTFLNDNVMALGGLPQADRESARSVLLIWPELMIAYLQNPVANAKALVNLMQDNQWPSAIEEDSIEELLVSLTTSAENKENSAETSLPDSSAEISSETLVLATPDIIELVCNQVIDSQEGLSVALEVCISMENENPAFFEAIEEYTSKVQDIVDVAEMSGLTGLIEVCTFINTNFVELSTQEKNQRVEAQPYFLAWPTKVLAYLQEPGTGASQLIHFMQEESWPAPLVEAEAVELLTLLTQPTETDTDDTDIATADDIAVEVEEEEAPEELMPLAVSIPDEIKLCKPGDLEVLVSGIEWGKEDLAAALNQLVTLSQQDTAFTEAQKSYTEPLEHWTSAAEMVGLEALQTIFAFVTLNVNELQKIAPEAVKKSQKILEKWPDLVLAYLQAPTDNVIQLVNHFRLSKWVQPLSDEAAQALLTQLVSGAKEVAPEPGEVQTRQTEAQPEDVILTPQDDVDPELWEAYLQELPQNAESFSDSIQKIIQEPDLEEIKSAQRVAHTMKGSSRIVGVKGIASIAHHLEDTLEHLAEHQLAPPEALTNMMVDAADCLSAMVDALSGTDEPPANALEILQSVLDWANQIDKGELDAPPVPKKIKAEYQKPTTEVVPSTQKSETDNKKKVEKAATPEQMLQVSPKTIDELMRLVGELSISLGQIQEKLKHVTQDTRLLTERDFILQKKTFELENLVDVRGVTGVENHYKTAMPNEDEDFDPLEFEEYNELHSVAHSFTESIADNRELALSIREELTQLETMFIHQERLNKDFQNTVMTTRMKKVKTIIPQLERNVRKTANLVKKKAKLEVTGADILVDSEVLNNLIPPLRHVLNNAVDHGLEIPEERTIVGKSEEGVINLSFYHEGNNVVIKCQDDGAGLNYTNIRFKAIEKELITENQELAESELARLILMSGFSTNSSVTQVSGRGVGMDVVHTTIRDMKGTLDLTSETGKGTTFLIKLPMTLVTVHVLVVRIGDRKFGIPTNNLEQALAPGVAEYHTVGEETTLKLGKNLYAIKYLADLLHIKGSWNAFNALEKRPVVLVHEETGITAVLVDEFLDTHDLVMKSMGNYVKNIHGVTGASILGDGSLVPLLDVPELLRSPMQAAISAYAAKHSVEDDPSLASSIPNIMIVDDSLSVRKSLSLLIENAGFEALLAKDGVEAIEVMNETHPNVMLVDMEMPRMNGIELTTHVRANQATQNLPIFMITSRTTEKHRQQAKSAGVSAYLTKPYQDTELLDLIDKALSGQI